MFKVQFQDLLPPKRRAVISSLPEVDLPLPDEGLGTGFGKKLVISQIGGNLQVSVTLARLKNM